jgi:hypothetical protein
MTLSVAFLVLARRTQEDGWCVGCGDERVRAPECFAPPAKLRTDGWARRERFCARIDSGLDPPGPRPLHARVKRRAASPRTPLRPRAGARTTSSRGWPSSRWCGDLRLPMDQVGTHALEFLRRLRGLS